MAAVLKRWPWNSQSVRKIEGRTDILASDGYESFPGRPLAGSWLGTAVDWMIPDTPTLAALGTTASLNGGLLLTSMGARFSHHSSTAHTSVRKTLLSYYSEGSHRS
jgi:hypothetical protein